MGWSIEREDRRPGRGRSRPGRPGGVRRAFAWRAGLLGVVLLAVAVVLRKAANAGTPVPGADGWPQVALAGVGFLAAAVFVGRRARSGSAGTVARWARRYRRNDGMASRLEVWRRASRWGLLPHARAVRPSLRGVAWWRLVRVPVTEYAVPVCRISGRWAYSLLENVVGVVGPPRSGKSVALLPAIVDAPGAVLVASTRVDLLDAAAPARLARIAAPVLVFNPSDVGGAESTLRWSPLQGCKSFPDAHARATDLVAGRAGTRSTEGERWDAFAADVLALLLHAAACAGVDLVGVQRWIADPTGPGNEQAVLGGLRRSPGGDPDSLVVQYREFLRLNDRTRTSITSSMMPALRWLLSPAARAAVTDGGELFDVAGWLASGGQLYVLGNGETLVGPLVTAFVGFVAREARRLSRLSRGGRLDPPLTLVLDEVKLTRPPLPDWSADFGGSGCAIVYAVQSTAALEEVWGPAGRKTILANTGTLIRFGGGADAEELETFERLAGHREDEEGRRVPILTAAQIGQLPPWRVLVLRRGGAPSIGRVPKAWRRGDIRRARRAMTAYEKARNTDRPGQPGRRWYEPAAAPAGATERVGVGADG